MNQHPYVTEAVFELRQCGNSDAGQAKVLPDGFDAAALRKRPETAPDPAGRAFFQQHAAHLVPEDQHVYGFFTDSGGRLWPGKPIHLLELESLAVFADRTSVASRRCPGTDQRTKVHDGLSVIGAAFAG